jgi:hypothetical protein
MLVFFSVLVILPTQAQEMEETQEEMPSMSPPEPLSGEFNNWMIGEWEGYSESPWGKTQDVMKCKWTLDNQFILINYTGKTVEMSKEAMQEMGESMGISDEDMEKMMEMPYKGMGVISENPQTGEMFGYWFDNWRGDLKGTGKQEMGKQTMTWTGAMGTEVRTMEMVNKDKMVVTFKSSGPMGEFEGKSEYTRKKVTM